MFIRSFGRLHRPAKSLYTSRSAVIAGQSRAASPLLYFRLARMASSLQLPSLPIFEAISQHDPKSTAIIHSLSGRRFTYGQLLSDVAEAKVHLQQAAGLDSLNGERIAFLVENSYDYVVNILAIFGAHAIAVPMSPSFPTAELRYILENSESAALLASDRYQSKAQEVLTEKFEGLARQPTFVHIKKTDAEIGSNASVELRNVLSKHEGGMMLHTSGTTSRPKGVLLRQSVLTAQCKSLQTAWEYSPNDHLLHVLPLHHIHGTVNALLTPLFAGSAIEMLFPFNVDKVFERFAAPFLADKRTREDGSEYETVTFWTVVPTIYQRLLNTFPKLTPDIQAAVKEALKRENLRLNISGSAALPRPTRAAWSELSSGNTLLERFGMTESGMALSCGLADVDRVDGSVGWPLPSVQVRLIDTETGKEIAQGDEVNPATHEPREGELQLRGPTVFSEYWRNEEATRSEFVDAEDGGGKWFKTGDVAVRVDVSKPNEETRGDQVTGTGLSGDWARGPAYFIRGRKSVDIIKTGGEKVSALEIEREMLGLAEVAECAVVGLNDATWGQKVAAVVVLTEAGRMAGGAKAGKNGSGSGSGSSNSNTKPWGPMDMRRALKERLATYKVPQELRVVDSIPRNAMGKINKKALVADLWPAEKQ